MRIYQPRKMKLELPKPTNQKDFELWAKARNGISMQRIGDAIVYLKFKNEKLKGELR